MKKISILFLLVISLFLSSKAYAEKEIIGKWIIKDKYVGRTIEIYKENGKVYLHRQMHSDGSIGEYLLIQEKNSSGETIYKLPDSDTGDYYKITRFNRLQIRDNLGLISVAQPVK